MVRALTLAVEDVIADFCGANSRAFPRHANAGAVIKQRPTRRVRWRVGQQLGGDNPRLDPAVAIPWPVAFAIAPPRKLAGRLFAALVDDAAGSRWKFRTGRTIEYRPADSHHAVACFTPGLPVQCKGEALVLGFLAAGLCIGGAEQGGQYQQLGQVFRVHGVIVCESA